MNIFSSNYDWDNKKDDPLSNLISDTSLLASQSDEKSNTSRSRPNSNYSRETRSSSTFLDNFLNEELPITEQSKKSVKFNESTIQNSTTRKSTNWLGLNESKELTSSSADLLKTATNKEDDDWLTDGLNRRQQKKIAQISKNEYSSQIDNKQKNTLENQSTSDKIDNDKRLMKNYDNENNLKNDLEGELIVLRTKVSILEIEKLHLTESIDKLNANHEQEINLLKQLHEQQLGLTKSILNEQEKLIKDEKDRRIDDLQNQLKLMEGYLNENRIKTNEKINDLEQEWSNSINRLKKIHELTINRLIEQHEQEIETLKNFQTKFTNLDELLNKWQINSEKMESLHYKLSIEQDKLLDKRLNDIDLKDKQIENIENKWTQLSNNLQFERENSSKIKELFINAVDEQKKLIDKERQQLRDDRIEFEMERKKFLDARSLMEIEMDKNRELISQNLIEQNKENENLKLKQNELNQQQIEQMRKENEWKIHYEIENERLINKTKQLEKDQQKLTADLMELRKNQEILNSDRKLFEQKKDLFDKEKIKLESLAHTIVKRSEELEILSETVNLDKKANENLFQESEKLRKEFNEKFKILETNLIDLKRREMHLEKQSEIVHQEWRNLENERLTILCSLCSSSLQNQEKHNSEKIGNFMNTVRSSDLYLNINENDRSLLIWQITGQEDDVQLEEETTFLKNLRK